MPYFKILLIVSFILSGMDISAQTEEKKWSDKKTERKNRPFYIGIGAGWNSVSFRDFATSPLIYGGSGATIDLSTIRIDDKKETATNLNISLGNYSASIAESFSQSSVITIRNSYQQLYRLKKYSNERWNIKAGGRVGWLLNNRDNSSLGNNSFGLEIVGNLFGSLKVTRDLSRKKEKEMKIWFVRYKLKPLTRNISAQFNLGIINSNLRNGFAYIAQDGVINDSNVFADYRFNFLSGFRISTVFNYTIHLTKGNLVRLGYIWDAYHTGEEFDKFEMASHQILLSLWFRTK
ncbi:MAG: hypothetical protein WBA74_08190 [Cyclobacteriaceae bacterium]